MKTNNKRKSGRSAVLFFLTILYALVLSVAVVAVPPDGAIIKYGTILYKYSASEKKWITNEPGPQDSLLDKEAEQVDKYIIYQDKVAHGAASPTPDASPCPDCELYVPPVSSPKKPANEAKPTDAKPEDVPPIDNTETASKSSDSPAGKPAPSSEPEPTTFKGPNSNSKYYKTNIQNYEIDENGKVWIVDDEGNVKGPAFQKENEVIKASKDYTKQTEIKKKTAEIDDAGAAPQTHGDTSDDGPSMDFVKASWSGIKDRVRASGGWYSAFFKPGPQQQFWRSIGRWSGVHEPAWPGFVSFMQSWSPTNLANSIFCENRLGDDTGQRIGMSNSGLSWISAEGVKIRVNPCPAGLAGKAPAANISCNPYWLYRISGEAVPSEVRLYFNVELRPGNVDMYDGFTIRAEKGSAKWSLSGTNMFVFNSTKEYTQVCIDFDDSTFTEVQTVFLALDDDDDPLCNDIVMTPQNPEQVFTTGSGGVILPPPSTGRGGAGSQSQIPPNPSKNL